MKVNLEEIKMCKEWIDKFITPIKTINKKFGAYKLKHCVEDYFGSGAYVSKESFIKSAKELGYNEEGHYFNMSFNKALKNSKQSKLSIGEPIEKNNLFLVEELAERLRVSNMTIYRYIQAGKLKAHKIGKEFRITEEEFNKFLNKSLTK